MKKTLLWKRILPIILCALFFTAGCGTGDVPDAAGNTVTQESTGTVDLSGEEEGAGTTDTSGAEGNTNTADGSGAGEIVEQQPDYTVLKSTDGAIELSLHEALQEELFVQEFTLESEIYLGEPDDYCHRSEFRRNSNSWFYTEDYSVQGLQSSYCNKIYQYHIASGETTLLYETRDVNWLNELEVSEDYLYWVEYIYDEELNLSYHVMQWDLSAGKSSCIATRDAARVGELCLATSHKYLTWYDDYLNGTTEPVIFDIAKQSFVTVPNGGAFKYMPYSILTPMDDGVSFFTRNEEGKVCINRYVPATEEMFTLELQYLKSTDKMAECFSNDRYIGWITEYSQGIYYLYDRDTGRLYSLNAGGKLDVFDLLLTDEDKVYIDERTTGRFYCCDMDDGNVTYQEIDGEYALYFDTVDGRNVCTSIYPAYENGVRRIKLVTTKQMR